MEVYADRFPWRYVSLEIRIGPIWNRQYLRPVASMAFRYWTHGYTGLIVHGWKV
jgi:hypothetical protein